MNNYFVSINFRVIFDNEFSFVSSRGFSCVFKFKKTIIGAVNDEGFLVNCIFQSEFGNKTFGSSLNWEFNMMSLLLTNFLLEGEYLRVWLLSSSNNLVFEYLPCSLVLHSHQGVIRRLAFWSEIQSYILSWVWLNDNLFFFF